MIKVKEWLDANFFYKDASTAELKENGHYNVSGYWGYPYTIDMSKDYIQLSEPLKNKIRIFCNNETLVICYIIINGKSVSKYGYLQTYEHIPRGEADDNGYYRRSTDEEIIKYLDDYFQQIRQIEKNIKML